LILKSVTLWNGAWKYRIPLAVLEKYAKITRPSKGIEWKANFYKDCREHLKSSLHNLVTD